MSKHQYDDESELEDLNFLKAFAINNISTHLSLEDEERAANTLLHAAYAKSKKYLEEHKYTLPDHLEQFRRGYEKADHKAKGRIPMVSTLSPRTRRELSLLPPPNAFEEKKIDKLVELSKKTDKSTLYGQLALQQPLEEGPRLTGILNSSMVLIPHNAVKDVGKASTHYFETMEHAKLRKQEQDAKLAKLFDKYKDAATDEPTKGRGSTGAKTASLQKQTTAPRTPKGKRVLPKLSATTAAASLVIAPDSHLAPLSSFAAPPATALAAPSTLKSASGKSSGFSLSRSLTNLGATRWKSPEAVAAKTGAGMGRPSSVQSKLPSPTKASPGGTLTSSLHYAAAQAIDSETLQAENTPLLYSMFKANPLLSDRGGGGSTTTERGVRYNQAAMAQIISERYQHESERLARITAKLQQKSEQEYLNLFSVQVLDEIGLDLNKEFNKIRNYTIYLMQLSFHFYIQRMRAGFMHFHAQYLKVREARLKRARKVIFRSVKLGVHILTQNERRRRKLDQDHAEELRLLEADAIFRKKCLLVFRTLYYHKQMKILRRRVRQRRAATLIQRHVRGRIGRRVAREWKALRALLSRSALTIQCAYRQHLAIRKVTLARKLYHVKMLLEDLQRFRSTCQQQMRLDGAELHIAKAYRTLVLRRKLKNLLYWNRYRCAVLIQRIYLGYRVRRKFLKVWALHKKRVAYENECAHRIQQLVRAFLARRNLRSRAQVKLRLARERRARKLMILATTTNRFNLKWMLVKLYRKSKPFRIRTLRKKAVIIQKVWRGHRGRKRALIVRVMHAIKAINVAFHCRIRAAITIQCNWRGLITRLRLMRARKYKLAVRIQTLWRLIHAKRRVQRLKKLHKDAQLLTRRLHRLYKKHKFHIKYLWQQQRTPYVVRIQALMRGAVSRVRHARMLSARRQTFETTRFITTRLNQLLSATQLQLIRDTMKAPIGHNTHNFSGENCTCLGPVQALFTLAACGKGRTDPVALVTNKADSGTLIKMLNKVKGLMDKGQGQGPEKGLTTDSSIGGGGDNNKKKKKAKRVNPIIEQLSLFLEFDAGRIPLPPVLRKLKPNHIDILFNRAKTEVGNLLSYDNFVDCLRLVAEAHYAKAELVETAVDEVNTTLPAAAVVGVTGEGAGKGAEIADPPNRKLDHAAHHFQQAGHKRRVHQISLARLKCNPQELFAGPEPDFRMALVLNAFASMRHDDFMSPILEWVHRESCARIDVFVVRIQACVRRHLSKKIICLRTKLRDEQRLAMKLWNQATKVQSLARMFVHRYRLARLAQRTIVQYVPHFGEPYWFHPRTKVKSWAKPKVLRNLDSYSVALPEEGLENVVNCTYCSKQAEVNCSDCEDSMCRICYDSMHCKGARTRHRAIKIPHCAYCKYQVATKACLTCIITPPAKGNIRESIEEAERGSYCDTCFVHEHDSNEKALHLHKQRKKGLQNLLSYSSQAYLIDQYLRQRIITSHHYEDLVQSCEECCTRSSTWRCQDCNQVYCSSCLVGLHSMGGPFARHRAEQLPYFTPEMHVSFKKDINRQLFQQKMEKLNRVEKARREEHHHQCAIKLQAWWRMIIYGYRGRKEMKRRRRRQRIAYKAHKRDTLEKRNTFSYRLFDALGCAPPLLTDTREEQALRTLTLFQKEGARTFIEENMDDWGFYRVSRVLPRKGVPHTGFQVGTHEELSEQAHHGGYRLPGRAIVVAGEQTFATTRDLTRVLRPGEYVRIRRRLFGVVRVTSTTIRVNRFWHAGVDDAKPDEDGELMYRAPLYRGEPRRVEFRARYLAYTALVENPLSQVGVRAYRLYAGQMMRFALYMVRSNRRNGMKEEEQTWRAAAARYADNIRYADSLLSSGDEVKSLFGTDRVRMPPLVMQEDAFSQSMKKGKSFKSGMGALAGMASGKGMSNEDDLDGLLDRDDSGSHDSWGAPDEDAVRPKSALRRGATARKLNRVVPGEDGATQSEDVVSLLGSDEDPAAAAAGLARAGSFEQGDGMDLGSDTSSKSKRSGMLSAISSKFFNSEEADAVRAAADAMHELEKADLPKAAGDVAAVLAEKKKAKEEKKKKKFEKPKEPWYASAEQLDARADREDKMTPQELALEADDWKECIDVMTENIYYLNVKTNEMFSSVPRAVAAKRQLEFENSKNKKNYDDAQKRIRKMEEMLKNRKLITGGVHR